MVDYTRCSPSPGALRLVRVLVLRVSPLEVESPPPLLFPSCVLHFVPLMVWTTLLPDVALLIVTEPARSVMVIEEIFGILVIVPLIRDRYVV